MKVAALTITYNRLESTKRMLESFYSKTNVAYHLFVDNGSTDGTVEWLQGSEFDYIPLPENKGITYAMECGLTDLLEYDFILKVDNDIEIVTESIIARMLEFYEKNGLNFITAPIDISLHPDYKPTIIWEGELNGFNVSKTSHVGGAFMMMPREAVNLWINEKDKIPGDLQRGYFFQKIGYLPIYLKDLAMNHFGINNQVTNYIL